MYAYKISTQPCMTLGLYTVGDKLATDPQWLSSHLDALDIYIQIYIPIQIYIHIYMYTYTSTYMYTHRDSLQDTSW